MSSVLVFKLILLSLIAVIGLELLAQRLRLPPAAALLVGGAAMAFVPGLPRVESHRILKLDATPPHRLDALPLPLLDLKQRVGRLDQVAIRIKRDLARHARHADLRKTIDNLGAIE